MKEKSIKLNAVLNVMKTVLSLVFPLITFPYITRVLQVNAIGKYDFSVSVISYFSLIAALGITTYAVREGTKYRGDQEKMKKSTLIKKIKRRKVPGSGWNCHAVRQDARREIISIRFLKILLNFTGIVALEMMEL